MYNRSKKLISKYGISNFLLYDTPCVQQRPNDQSLVNQEKYFESVEALDDVMIKKKMNSSTFIIIIFFQLVSL